MLNEYNNNYYYTYRNIIIDMIYSRYNLTKLQFIIKIKIHIYSISFFGTFAGN